MYDKKTEVPRLVFWFDSTPRVEAGSFNYVADNWENDVFFFCMEKMKDYRKKSGWVERSFENANVIYFSEIDKPKDFFVDFIEEYPDAIHIFNGFRSKTSTYLDMYIESNLDENKKKVIVWSERPGVYGSTYKKIQKKIFLNLLYKYIYYKYNDYVKILLPLGTKGVDTFASFGWNRNKIYPYMYNPISNFNKSSNDEYPINNNDKKVKFLYVGRFSKSTKGIDILIDAFNEIQSDNWKLTLVGGYGDYKDQTISWAEENNNIEFIGSWNSDEVATKMKEYDIVVVPSRFDGWNVVVNESLCAGIGAIVSDEAVSDELIRKSGSGIVYPSKDVKELQNAIQKVIDNPEIITEWKLNSKKFFENISEETVGNYLIKIIKENFIKNNDILIECPWQE